DAALSVLAGSATTPVYSTHVNTAVGTQGQHESTDVDWRIVGAFQPDSHSLSVKFTKSGSLPLNIAAVKIVEVGPVTSFTYDDNGNRTSLTDPDGNKTTWFYDNLNRVKQEENQLDESRYYVYDAASNLV